MADISKITLPNGTTYDIRDEYARTALSNHLQKKVVTSLPTASADTMDGMYLLSENSGTSDVYAEYITIRSGESGNYTYKWEKIGSTATELSNYSKTGHTHSYSKVNSVDAHSYTPAGSINAQGFTGNKATVSVTGTPTGSVSKPNVTVTPTTATKYVAASASGGGAVTAGAAATCTLPTMSMTVSDTTLVIGWTAGSFKANTPTKVTLPTFASQVIVSGVSAALETTPTFTGNSLTSTGSLTPTGSVEQATFSGTPATLSHTVNQTTTATGTNSK